MTKKEIALDYFNNSHSCSQAILKAYAGETGLDEETSMKISCGFSGGMRVGNTCGAVSAGIMVIGMVTADADAKNKKAKEKTYEKVKEFLRKFDEKNDSVFCRELLGYDLGTEMGSKSASKNKVFKGVCPGLLEDVVDLLEEVVFQR